MTEFSGSDGTNDVLTVDVDHDGAIVVVGEIDMAGGPLLESVILEREGAGSLVIDLAAVTFIDSSGLRSLLGASRVSVARRHLMPIMLPLALPHLPLIFASALLIEAGLCFLGAGDPNRLSWGLLVQTGQSHALRAWWLALFPGLALAFATAGLSLLPMAWNSDASSHG